MTKENKKQKQQKKNIVVSLNIGKTIGGYVSGKRNKANRKHARTFETKANKVRKLKAIYRRLFRNSQKAKESYEKASKEVQQKIDYRRKTKEHFCDKYLTVESYLKNYSLKEVGIVSKSGPTISSEHKKELKDRIRRGGILGNY